MPTKAITGIKIVDGKKIVRKIGFRSKIKRHRDDRELKAWQLKAALASSKRPA